MNLMSRALAGREGEPGHRRQCISGEDQFHASWAGPGREAGAGDRVRTRQFERQPGPASDTNAERTPVDREVVGHAQLVAVEVADVIGEIDRGDRVGRHARGGGACAAARSSPWIGLGRRAQTVFEIEVGHAVGQPARVQVLAIAQDRDRQGLVRNPHDLGSEAPSASAMPVCREPAIRAERQPGPVVEGRTVGEGAG